MSGYSKTPLVRKLGIKEGNLIWLVNEPAHYVDLIGVFPPECEVLEDVWQGKKIAQSCQVEQDNNREGAVKGDIDPGTKGIHGSLHCDVPRKTILFQRE